MAVHAYFLQYQEGNVLLSPNQAEREFDGAALSPLLATLNTVGIEAFTMNLPIFVPVGSLALMANLAGQCKVPPEKVIFVIGEDVKPEEPYLSAMRQLREKGFRFAMQGVEWIGQHREIAALCSFIFLSQKQLPSPAEQAVSILREHSHLEIAVTDIDTQADYEGLKAQGPVMFEGRFYRVPLTKGAQTVSPLKLNLIKLLNLVRDKNFEFSDIAAAVQQDTALSVNLITMINSPALGLRQKVTSINHAVTILGQIEVGKWVTTAVSKLLGSDKPDELTRLSLIRARFAENLAPGFGLKDHADSLFLLGLFSVLDVILEVPMEQALEMVQVSDDIKDALLDGKGKFGEVLIFMQNYEAAAFKQVSRAMIIHDLAPEDIYRSYIGALGWYQGVVSPSGET